MPRKKQTDIEQPELIAEEAAEYIVSPDEEADERCCGEEDHRQQSDDGHEQQGRVHSSFSFPSA